MVSLCTLVQHLDLTTLPVEFGESIASEGKGEYMYVEGQVLTTEGKPIADAVIDTWETDRYGVPLVDNQYHWPCADRYQGSTTRNTPTGHAQTAVGDCAQEKMAASHTVLSFPHLIPFRVT